MRVSRLTLGLLLASGAGFAQVPPPGPERPRPAAPQRWGGEDEQLFLAPSGEPFRAPIGAAYPVSAWFAQADRNRDGRISQAEFSADFGRFFDRIDADHDGIVRQDEIKAYEQAIAPEVQSFEHGGFDRGAEGSRRGHRSGGRRGGGHRGGPGDGSADPGEGSSEGSEAAVPDVGKSSEIERDLRSERPFGGGRFSMINIPEPVASMDVDFSGSVSREEMRAAANRRFALLDREGRGYLAIPDLPQTWSQQHPPRR